MPYQCDIKHLIKLRKIHNTPVWHLAYKLENHSVVVQHLEAGMWRKLDTCISLSIEGHIKI